jgi:hypothetical protein
MAEQQLQQQLVLWYMYHLYAPLTTRFLPFEAVCHTCSSAALRVCCGRVRSASQCCAEMFGPSYLTLTTQAIALAKL